MSGFQHLFLYHMALSVILFLFFCICGQGYYWSMWQYFQPITLSSKLISAQSYTLDLTKIPSINNYDQLRLQIICLAFSGVEVPWQVVIMNDGFPKFMHMVYGYASPNNEYSFNSENIICPVSNTTRLVVNVYGRGGSSTISFVVRAGKYKLQKYLQIATEYQKEKIKIQKSSYWDQWVYFNSVKRLQGNITSNKYTFNYSNLPNITMYQCIKHYFYFATGRTWTTVDLDMQWINNGKPEFQHKTQGVAYQYQAGFAYNTENIVLPLSKTKTLKFTTGPSAPGGGYDFFRVFQFGLKFLPNISATQKINALQNLRKYYKNDQIGIELEQYLKEPTIQDFQSYPYAGYWDDWFYFQPVNLYSGATKPGKYSFNFSDIFGSKVSDEVKIHLLTKNGVASGGSYDYVFRNEGTVKFEFYSTAYAGAKGGITYNSQIFIAPTNKYTRLTLTIPSNNFSGNVFTFISVIGLKFMDTLSFQEKQNIRNQIRLKEI